MEKLTVFANAKVNLTLDVLGKMPDGYHDLKSIMQAIELHDDVEISVSKGTGKISVRASKSFIPKDERNVAGKAARLFLTKNGINDHDISVYITKRNPVCAGLGGGSADGAAVLKGLNKLFGEPMSEIELMELGEKVGADVPFCVMGGTALACGKGEILTRLTPLPDCHIVICKPEFPISTPELFNYIDSRKVCLRPDTDGMLDALNKGDLRGVSRRLYNVFEELVMEEHYDIKVIKDTLYDCGAMGASMSGTGSAVFGIFDDEIKAKDAYSRLKKMYNECFLTKAI